MYDLLEIINDYLQRKAFQKRADLVSLFDNSDAAQQASQAKRYFPFRGIPISQEALDSPDFVRYLLETEREGQNRNAFPEYDPNNPFAQLALAEKMYDLQSRLQERQMTVMANLMHARLQSQMMQQALQADIASRRWQMMLAMMQSYMLPALERYRVMMESQRPHVITSGGNQPPSAASLPPQYVRVQI